MTIYTLAKVTASQAAIKGIQGGAVGSNLPVGSFVADLSGAGALGETTPPNNQAFHVIVTGNSPGVSVSGTVQVVASNDGINWVTYGSAITVNSGASPQNGSATGTVMWAYYSATITAIGSNGSTVTVLMNA